MPLTLEQIQDRYQRLLGPLPVATVQRAHRRTGQVAPVGERGIRATPENSLKYLYRLMWVDPDLRRAILDIREMDRVDPRVKKIHRRTAAAAVKGGLKLENPAQSARVQRAWERFARRLRLDRRDKLISDARGLMMEGNCPLQWVLDADARTVAAGVRMPAETILPQVDAAGRFPDPSRAYVQFDINTGAELARFALWQLSLGRLTPDNHDDQGALGRPYLDASRTVWKKLTMTEEDLVLRRRMRAPLRMSHILEGASAEELQAYQERTEAGQAEGVTTDYYSNRKGGVTPIQGDANLDQIADVVHLLDTFFAGAPAPKGLFGYTEGLARDILEDLKRDFFDEVDALQDELAAVYQSGFELQLLLDGMAPDGFDFRVQFAERRTETPNQAADRALKVQALGASQQTVLEIGGLDPAAERRRREREKDQFEPYPEPGRIRARPGVSVTPGNQAKGESSTDIRTRTGND